MAKTKYLDPRGLATLVSSIKGYVKASEDKVEVSNTYYDIPTGKTAATVKDAFDQLADEQGDIAGVLSSLPTDEDGAVEYATDEEVEAIIEEAYVEESEDKLIKYGRLNNFFTNLKTLFASKEEFEKMFVNKIDMSINIETGELEYAEGTIYHFEVDYETGMLNYTLTI